MHSHTQRLNSMFWEKRRGREDLLDLPCLQEISELNNIPQLAASDLDSKCLLRRTLIVTLFLTITLLILETIFTNVIFNP